jgi:hypothetical protein
VVVVVVVLAGADDVLDATVLDVTVLDATVLDITASPDSGTALDDASAGTSRAAGDANSSRSDPARSGVETSVAHAEIISSATIVVAVERVASCRVTTLTVARPNGRPGRYHGGFTTSFDPETEAVGTLDDRLDPAV